MNPVPPWAISTWVRCLRDGEPLLQLGSTGAHGVRAGGTWCSKHEACASLHGDSDFDAVAGKQACCRVDDVNHERARVVMRLRDVQGSAEALLPQVGSPGAIQRADKAQVAGQTLACHGVVGARPKRTSRRSHASRGSFPLPERRSANRKGRSPRMSLESRAITSRSAPT